MLGSAFAASSSSTISVCAAPPSPRITASSSAVQPRLLTWFTSIFVVEQFAHRGDVAVVRGGDERGAAVAVGAFQVGARGDGHADDLDVAARAGEQEGAVADAVLRVHVGAGRDQQARRLDAILLRRRQQRGAAGAVARRTSAPFASNARTCAASPASAARISAASRPALSWACAENCTPRHAKSNEASNKTRRRIFSGLMACGLLDGGRGQPVAARAGRPLG